MFCCNNRKFYIIYLRKTLSKIFDIKKFFFCFSFTTDMVYLNELRGYTFYFYGSVNI